MAHPSFRFLYEEHRELLEFARSLRADVPEGLRGGLPARGQALVDAVKQRFAALEPQLRVEERELIPLGVCAGAQLRMHAQRVQEEHERIRTLVDTLALPNLRGRLDALGVLVEEHIRFEEGVWFPALAQELDAQALDGLALRAQRQPESLITGFHQDPGGDWAVELSCGHACPMREGSPSQATWVTDPGRRADKLGTRVRCQSCQMPRMPPCAVAYKSTPVFDDRTVPRGLLRSHCLRADSWAEIVVLRGRVAYVLEDEANLTFMLRPGLSGVVAPGRPHHVELQPGSSCKVVFLRCAP